MNYQETLAYLYQKLPVFHRIGAAALKPGLDNITALCEALGNPHRQLKCIHVGGTNGKGSTSHLLSAVLQSAGYNVGLHTSPHLKSYTERFKINGRPCDERTVSEFVTAHRALIEQIQPSFFEISVALAFDYFARQQVDIAIIEVGLGGRLDSTNIITPLLSVITNISLDHTELLGDTLEKIAVEKAGIIKPGIPVVVSEWQPETAAVFQKNAAAMSAEISFASLHYTIESKKLALGKRWVRVTSENKDRMHCDDLEMDLAGHYQLKNLPGVFESIRVLQGLGYTIEAQAVRTGLAQCTQLTSFKGRWQVLGENPIVVADVAHNEGGLRETLQQIQSYPYDALHLVLGFVKDKDVAGILPLFPVHAHFYFCSFDSPRALSPETLVYIANNLNIKGMLYREVNEALAAARQNAASGDLIYVGGSTFVVAELSEI